MKTALQLQALLSDRKAVDSHVHTHLCDGNADMTVENIARAAVEKGIGLIVLTPHFHKTVSDESDTLYTDTDENMLLSLREEIDRYEKNNGSVKFLLSAEADILSVDGALSLSPSPEAEKALDLISPTLNYHPLLPLYLVRLTYGKYVNALHESGEYLKAAEKIGGVEAVLESAYLSEINAIKHCPYPPMLGHLFMSVSAHPDERSAFGAKEEHLPLLKKMTQELILLCKEKQAFIDITGVHLKHGENAEGFIKRNGYHTDLHRFTAHECVRHGVCFNYGSDAHSLPTIASAHSYYETIIKN